MSRLTPSSLLIVFTLFWLPTSSGGPALAAQGAGTNQSGRPETSGTSLPRALDGKPNLQGIWQVRNRAAYDLENRDAQQALPAGTIPYQPWAAAKKAENFSKRQTADPLAQCYMPGVPRIMYMAYPFH